jgi:tetratricopeptide (TPR) repeat protein
LNEIVPTKPGVVSAEGAAPSTILSGDPASIRVSPNSYFNALFLATFFTGFFVYLEIDWAAVLLFALSWILLPLLAFTDRIVFDGKRLSRTGILPNAWAFLNGSRSRLRLSDVEQAETQALRALKRGGTVFYRYRTSIRGKDMQFAFASGGEDYRQMIRQIFPRLSENVLDNRSIELRDYLAEPKETLTKAEFEHIPSPDVLESSLKGLYTKDRGRHERTRTDADGEDFEKAEYLRRLANELRLSGHLLQALEAFRRALVLNPRDNWMLFELARCLQSFAGSERDRDMERRALALMRLAERRAQNDGELLARLGESYFQFGEWERAGKVFQRALERVETSFRSVRGLAEIALREGKIAHVIHHFSTANRLAETPALRRWTRGEADYFSRLNTDDTYMEMEVSRINLLDTLERSKKTTLKITFLGFPAILIGVVLDESLIANLGWAVSAVSLLIWTGLIMSQRMLSGRIPLEMVPEED